MLRTVASLGILAFAFAVLYGCWMRRRGDSDEMERRRAERERHLDGALGEHLHLGKRDARRLARRELERAELERAEEAAAAAAGMGTGRGGSLEMSEIGGAGASASPTQVGSWTCYRKMRGLTKSPRSSRLTRTTERRCSGRRSGGRRGCSRAPPRTAETRVALESHGECGSRDVETGTGRGVPTKK